MFTFIDMKKNSSLILIGHPVAKSSAQHRAREFEVALLVESGVGMCTSYTLDTCKLREVPKLTTLMEHGLNNCFVDPSSSSIM